MLSEVVSNLNDPWILCVSTVGTAGPLDLMTFEIWSGADILRCHFQPQGPMNGRGGDGLGVGLGHLRGLSQPQ